MVLIRHKRHRFAENDGDIILVHPQNHSNSTIRLLPASPTASEAEFVLLHPAKALHSTKRLSKESDAIAIDIMNVCIEQIAKGCTVLPSGHLIEDKQVIGYSGYRELKVQPFRLLYKICTKFCRDGSEKKVVVALRFFRKQTEQLTQQDKENAKKSFIQWRNSEMNTNQYTKIESTDTRKRRVKTEESDNISLPPSEERRKIILDMMLKGCYVSDIYERFGVECPDE